MQPEPANLIGFSVGRKRATSQALAQLAANGQGKDCSSLRAVTQVWAVRAPQSYEARRSTGTAHCLLGDSTRETTGIVSSAGAEATGKDKGKETLGKVWSSCQDPSLKSRILRQGKLIPESLCWWLPMSVLKLLLLNPYWWRAVQKLAPRRRLAQGQARLS